jgi:hypothetical protein
MDRPVHLAHLMDKSAGMAVASSASTTMSERTPPDIGLSSGEREHLTALRNSLLALHKMLIDRSRFEYERANGRVESPGEFLNILMNDPAFAWLAPFTSLIVRIDEGLAADELMTSEDVASLSGAARRLLVPDPNGVGFPKHYDDALQRDPGIVLAHREVMRNLARRTREREDG